MKMFIVIPAYNEGKTIGDVLSNLKKHGYHNIVVVNDCSKDNTEKISLQKGAVVLTHPINRGQGAALATGNEYSLRNGAEIIVNFDADGQMQAEDIPSVIEPIIKKEADVVYGSRYLTKKSNIPPGTRIAHFLGNMWLRSLGVRMSDPQSGFRAMSRKAAEIIEIKQDRTEHASEMLLEVFKKNLRCKEVPVTIKYTEYSMGHTQHGKIPLLSGIKIAFKTILGRLVQ